MNSPVWAEIDLEAIGHNTAELSRLSQPGAALMAVVKANAYGHGMIEVARTALASGASWLGVARVEEGISLRQAGFDCPVLVFGHTPSGVLKSVLDYDLVQTVYSTAGGEELNRLAELSRKRVPVHFKVDTGMGRLGFPPGGDMVREILACARLAHLEPQGIYSHFATSDAADDSYSRSQFTTFTKLLAELAEHGLEFPIRHMANSAAIIRFPETHLDLVRAGISMYGLSPSPEVDCSRVKLVPAMSFKALVAQVKTARPGTKISYGCTHTVNRDTVIATIQAGYADGYDRLLSSRSEILLHGQRARVVGRVCMDQFMVDVGHIPGVVPGDEAVLLGRQGGAEVSADELASLLGTINYEVVCKVSYRVPRFFV